LRYVLRRHIPPIARILLVESGSRSITEALLPRLRSAFGERIRVDLVTCYPGQPAGLPAESAVYRVSEYAGRTGRRRLYRELRALNYSLTGIVCSGETIMTKWKWALAVQVPAKIFVINENADFFWLDYTQRRIIAHFALVRSGLAGAGAARTAAQIAAFPFTLLFLLLYAATVHTRRALRQLTKTRKTRDSILKYLF
jgi:hypothetical protein